MPRDERVYLDDILEAIGKIQRYSSGMDFQLFSEDEKTIDAVVRNLEIIGEASNRLSLDLRSKNTDIEWHKIIGLRNILVHEYFGVNLQILWDVMQNKLPNLKASVLSLFDHVG